MARNGNGPVTSTKVQRMTSEHPHRTVRYDSPITEAARWDHYSPRHDDILICTPPKCGTTWTQAICALLIFGTPELSVRPGVISPWFDATHHPVEKIAAMLEAQTHRRFIKTHTPLDGIPFFPQCQYLAVFRDPRDAHFSMRNHALNQMSGKNAHRATEDIGAGFRQWSERPYIEGDPDNFSLANLVHHFKTYRAFEHLPNVHLMHYSDMQRDLRGEMKRCAAFLGIDVTDEALNAMAATASFANMKQKADQFVPGAGENRWKDEGRFFNKGANGQWRADLSAEDLAIYDTRIRDMLPAHDVDWLESGNG